MVQQMEPRSKEVFEPRVPSCRPDCSPAQQYMCAWVSTSVYILDLVHFEIGIYVTLQIRTSAAINLEFPRTCLMLLKRNIAGCTAVSKIHELLLKYTKCSNGCIANPLHGPEHDDVINMAPAP